MHSSVLVFYDNANDDMESIINRYYQDNEDEFKNEIQVPKENIKEATAEVLSKEYWINDLKSYARYKKMKPENFDKKKQVDSDDEVIIEDDDEPLLFDDEEG